MAILIYDARIIRYTVFFLCSSLVIHSSPHTVMLSRYVTKMGELTLWEISKFLVIVR